MRKGDHTWNIDVHYARCPICGFINEVKGPLTYHDGKYEKEINCIKCDKLIQISKKLTQIGPIFGDATPAEMEWED